MSIIDLIPGGRIGMLIGVGLLVAAVYAGHLVDVKVHEKRADAAGYKRGTGEVQSKWDAAEKVRATTAAAAEAAARAEEQRRAAAQLEVQRAHELALSRARADAAGAADAAGRLRDRIAALLASAGGGQAAGHPGAAVDRSPTSALGDVLGQCVERYRGLAVEADAARSAGLSCQQSYEALTPTPTN